MRENTDQNKSEYDAVTRFYKNEKKKKRKKREMHAESPTIIIKMCSFLR